MSISVPSAERRSSVANKAAEKEVTDLWSFCPECGPNVKVDEDGCCASCGNGAVGPEVIKLGVELHRLRSLATRWYLADGTYETLPEEEVIRRRMEAAKRAGDVEGMAKKL